MTGISEALGNGHPYTRAKFIRGWQDLCAVHDLRASNGENAPWWQDVRAAYSPAALCGAFWMHGTHILPKLAVFECMQAICCHELAFFSSRPLRERIRTISCHGRQLGNASRRYIAVARRRGECTARRMSPAGPNLRAGSRLSFRPERSCGAQGRSCGPGKGEAGAGRAAKRQGHGAAVSAGDRHPQREGRGRRRMARFPHQNKGSRPTPSSPKQKKASALLAFFCCSVYDSNDPRDLHGKQAAALRHSSRLRTALGSRSAPTPNAPIVNQSAKTLAHINEALAINRLLVFNNLLDCAHGALFNAVAASDAGLFVYNLAYAVYNLDAFLGASVDADAAANALIVKDYWMRHENLFSLGLLEILCRTWGQPLFG